MITEKWRTPSVLLAIGSLGPGGAERQLVGTLKGLKSAGLSVFRYPYAGGRLSLLIISELAS